jgi:sugar phosphate isomerase/epimerase
MFPFKLATTSYIYPDHILPNVVALVPFFDEIELVLFETEAAQDLRGDEQVHTLQELSSRNNLSYDVHLPMDIFLGDRNNQKRVKGMAVIKEIIQETLCLNPSAYILHLDPGVETDLRRWRKRVDKSLRALSGCGIESKRISVETLGYPFELVEDIVRRFDFSICLDIGHILIHGHDLRHYLEKYLDETSMVHLHGFQNGIDHQGIDHLPGETLALILSHLRDYQGIVSIEVFSVEDLRRSLVVLEEQWERRSF